MDLVRHLLIFLYLLVVIVVNSVLSSSNETFSNKFYTGFGKRSEVLSRRKRFLIFPEGSSAQLVFCLSFPMLIPVGDIFQYGYTAALAWELPQDPYSPFNHKADPLHRRVDTKKVVYTDERGRVLYTKPFHKKKFIVNPAFAKRSINGGDNENVIAAEYTKTPPKLKINRKRMHRTQTREFLKMEHMDEASVEFHRRSRASLYGKIESLLKTTGVDGKQCLLKALCQVGQTRDQEQGSFLQEILRAVLTIPKSQITSEDLKEYEDAHFSTNSCDDLYPECSESSQDPMMR